MNTLRILDLNNALLEGSNSFKTLKNISIEFDDNNNCIHSYHQEYAFVQARYNEIDVLLKISLKGIIEVDDNLLKDITLETVLYKNELKVINTKGEEMFVDILMIDDRAIELLSLITPNAPENIKNKEIISNFIDFLITINQERVVINGFSFDQCFMLDDKFIISPLKSSDVIFVGDTEVARISSFNNFTIMMLSEILAHICTNNISHSDHIYKTNRYEYYNSPDFTAFIKNNIIATGNEFSNLRELIGKSCRGDIAAKLSSPSGSVEIIKGNYSENRFAAYDNKLCKWGYMNLKSEIVIPFIYDQANGFYEDIAVVGIGESYGSINRYGEQLLDFCFKSLLWQGRDNIYIFKKMSLFGIIDRNGKILVDERYLHIGSFNSGCAIVQSADNEMFGAINSLGELIIKPIYDSIKPFHNMRTVAIKDGKSVVLDIFGDKI